MILALKRVREFDKSYRVICLAAVLGLIGFFFPVLAQEHPAPAIEKEVAAPVKSEPAREAQSETETENESEPEPEPLSTPAPATTPEVAPTSAPAPAPAVQQGPPVPKFEVLEKVYKEPVERTPHLKKTAGGVPLLIDGKEIFRIRASLGAYTAKVRVSSIEQRLKELIDDPDCAALIQQIKTEESGYSTNIVAGSHTLFTVTEPDAVAEGYSSRQELAKDYAYLLRKALAQELRINTVETNLAAIGLAILTTVALFFLIRSVNWLFRQVYVLLHRWKGTVIGPLKIQQAELVSAATITDLISGFIRATRVIVFISIISIYLSFVLSYFPATKPIAQEGIHLLLRPIAGVVWPAIISYIPNFLFIIFILISTYYVIAFTHFIFREIERETITMPGFDPDWSMPTYKIARFLIIAFAMILLFPYLPGAGSPAFQQVSIFLGVLFSLASTGALSHIISGIFLTYTGALRIGDRVKIADTVGDVMEKTLLATRIKTIKNEIITIPNGLVLGNHIVNYSASAKKGGLILHTSVTIGYDVPWQDVHEALLESARETEHILEDPAPFVWQTELGDYSVKYEINAYTEHPHLMARIYAEMHLKIQDRFHKKGIEILSPAYSAIRDGNKITIPANELPGNYQAPSFNVNLIERGGKL
ncbi:MAG: mechanosensitive ion channel family protein [Cyanobacteria bacterium HKST-UBA01]|nr:mechanosensitive ion channel family protein [Cyanobacteria bacterium HKST-UBA01]